MHESSQQDPSVNGLHLPVPAEFPVPLTPGHTEEGVTSPWVRNNSSWLLPGSPGSHGTRTQSALVTSQPLQDVGGELLIEPPPRSGNNTATHTHFFPTLVSTDTPYLRYTELFPLIPTNSSLSRAQPVSTQASRMPPPGLPTAVTFGDNVWSSPMYLSERLIQPSASEENAVAHSESSMNGSKEVRHKSGRKRDKKHDKNPADGGPRHDGRWGFIREFFRKRISESLFTTEEIKFEIFLSIM